MMSSIFTKTAFLVTAGFLLTSVPHTLKAQTYINDDSTVADQDDYAAGAEGQAFRNERYNDLIANMEISVQALEHAQQLGEGGEALHDKRKQVRKYLKLIKKQIEDIAELDDQSERVENELQQMRQAKAEGEAALEDHDFDDY